MSPLYPAPVCAASTLQSFCQASASPSAPCAGSSGVGIGPGQGLYSLFTAYRSDRGVAETWWSCLPFRFLSHFYFVSPLAACHFPSHLSPVPGPLKQLPLKVEVGGTGILWVSHSSFQPWDWAMIYCTSCPSELTRHLQL